MSDAVEKAIAKREAGKAKPAPKKADKPSETAESGIQETSPEVPE